MTPLDYYHQQCSTGTIFSDQEQLIALEHLQKIHQNLLNEQQKRSSIFAKFRKAKLVHGLYLWGGVGIGKTFLMDCFYHCVPFREKMRMHFHQFMQMVHRELKRHEGKKNPLQIIAKELAQKTLLLCFDELFVSDITDAMLLAELFKALFAQGVCLVATSNAIPDDLYKHGLQRERFLPAIALLKQNTTVLHIPTTQDYRLRHLKNAGVFYMPNDAAAHEKMETSFQLLTNGEAVTSDPLEIEGRYIQVKKQTDNVVWFDFDSICNIPRSQQDYLAIAKKFNTVFISNIPTLAPDARNIISLFIRLVDVFYDARIRLIFSAEQPIEQIYSHGYLRNDFVRTQSRLLEMQSEHYFSAMA